MKVVEKAKEFLLTRKQAYVHTFEGEHGEKVLKDLAKFCRASETTHNTDPRLTDILNGRREVFLRISEHLNLTEEDLYQKYR